MCVGWLDAPGPDGPCRRAGTLTTKAASSCANLALDDAMELSVGVAKTASG